MSFTFNADEVFEVAQVIERNGVRFYKTAAKQISDSDERKLLERLALDETSHEKLFTSMRSELADDQRAQMTFDPDDMTSLYLQALADKNVFDCSVAPESMFDENTTTEDILRMAIGMEKDSIVFYLGIKEAMKDQSNKERVEAIIREEMGHVATLSRELTRIVKA